MPALVLRFIPLPMNGLDGLGVPSIGSIIVYHLLLFCLYSAISHHVTISRPFLSFFLSYFFCFSFLSASIYLPFLSLSFSPLRTWNDPHLTSLTLFSICCYLT